MRNCKVPFQSVMIAVVMPPLRSWVLASELLVEVSKVASALGVSGMRQMDLVSGVDVIVPPEADLMYMVSSIDER